MQFRKLKAQKGFTLVEVIVVAVIVAILAGVSIPLYLGYINNSRDNAATNAAGSAASFAAACVNGGGTISLDATGMDGDGAKAITCTGSTATLIVPTDIHLQVEGGNTIVGWNITAHTADPSHKSQPFTFQTAAAAPPADPTK